MRALERVARAIVDTLPATVGVEEGAVAIDVALLRELRRALTTEVYQPGTAKTRHALGGDEG